jgi:hypothetical protein
MRSVRRKNNSVQNFGFNHQLTSSTRHTYTRPVGKKEGRIIFSIESKIIFDEIIHKCWGEEIFGCRHYSAEFWGYLWRKKKKHWNFFFVVRTDLIFFG